LTPRTGRYASPVDAGRIVFGSWATVRGRGSGRWATVPLACVVIGGWVASLRPLVIPITGAGSSLWGWVWSSSGIRPCGRCSTAGAAGDAFVGVPGARAARLIAVAMRKRGSVRPEWQPGPRGGRCVMPLAVMRAHGLLGLIMVMQRTRRHPPMALCELWPESIDNLASTVRAGISPPRDCRRASVARARAAAACDRGRETVRVAREVGPSDLGTRLVEIPLRCPAALPVRLNPMRDAAVKRRFSPRGSPSGLGRARDRTSKTWKARQTGD
jgi:hypothetical protein